MKKVQQSFISGNAKLLRNVNRAVILNLIRERQPISRSTIAQITGMNKSTVSNIVNELLEQHLLVEEKCHDPKIGRNPINLRLQLGQNIVGAINLDVPESYVAIVDIDGSILKKDKIPSMQKSPEHLLLTCLETLKGLCQEQGVSQIKGIGLSIAGISNPKSLMVHYAPRLGWENVALGDYLEKACPPHCLVTINNDAKAAALAELWFGERRGELSNFVYVYVGDGIGTGIVLNKELVNGAHHAAGEFGHTTIIEQGELCFCGNYGCWEAYASNHATIRRYLVSKRREPDRVVETPLEEVLLAARAGDQDALDVLAQTGRYLGLGIANILKAIDPEVVIIGGEITGAFDILFPEIQKTVRRRAFWGLERGVKILPSSIKVQPPQLIGAATLVISELFSDYRIVK